MSSKLTAATAAAAPTLKQAYSIGDGACPGLRLRVTANGVKTFAYAYRAKDTGKVVWTTIGHYPAITVARARELTNAVRKQIADGKVPSRSQPALKKSSQTTFADVVALYHAERLTSLRTGSSILTSLRRIGRAYGWNDRPIDSITDDEAAKMLHDIAVRRGKKANANQTKHLLHAMFKWAKQPGRKFVTVNPLADLPSPGGSIKPRDRFLSADEIRQLWPALEAPALLGIRPDAATALRLILTTAARPGMVCGMARGELHDLNGPSAHGPHWSLPAERMKAAAAFITPLSGLALELIKPHLKGNQVGNALLFDLPPYYLNHAARLVVAKLGMAKWTPHDLRRTAATILDRDGYSLEQIGALLAHSRRGVVAVYARHDQFELKREMALAIERSLRETLAGEPAAAVAA